MTLDDILCHLSRNADADYDVAEIALLIAQDEYPNLDVEAYLDQLRDLARDAKSHLAGSLPEQVHGLCRYLFHEVGLRGNKKEYYDPRNSYLSDVLDRLKGIPITLSVVTVAVGRRVGLPLAGLGLPGHFVVQCLQTRPLVVIDPFHGGRLLNVEECRALVSRVTGVDVPISPADFVPIPIGLLVQRLLNNLRLIYLNHKDWRRAARTLHRLRQLSPSDVQVRRDLGLCLLHLDQPGKAIDHLASYITAAAEAEDLEKVQKLHQKALRQVGRWN